jgi:hypothetical protein
MSHALRTTALPPSPDEWFATHVRPLFDEYGPYDPDSGRWLTAADLLDHGAARLRSLHDRLHSQERAPGATAATYLAGWFPGLAAEVVGLALATAGAGLLLRLEDLRWQLHPDGWPDRLEAGTIDVVVAAGHPWADLDGVTVVAAPDEVASRAVHALVTAVTPLIDACHGLARVGRAGLWNEVGDGLVMAVRHDGSHHVEQAMIDTVHAASRLPGAPWRAHAQLRMVQTPWGTTCVGQKGGCCLAYKRPAAAFDAHDDPADADTAEFRRRFPQQPDEPRYCGTCSLRDRADAEARQLFWFELSKRSVSST